MSLEHAGQSIPKSCGRWADILGAYRLLSNGAVDPHEIQRPHRDLTREACVGRGVVLAVADITDLDYTDHPKTTGLGKLGDGRQRGLQQHTVLAVEPEGGVLGILDQRWYTRPESPEGESRRARQSRWCEADVWSDAVRTIGASPEGCRLIHVGDRGADNFSMIRACVERGVGFLIRAMHDRLVDGGPERLWAFMGQRPVLGSMEVEVSAHRTGMQRDRRAARTARVALRGGTVEIPAPINDPRHTGASPCLVHVVYVCEEEPPEGVQPVDWMLLGSEAAADRRGRAAFGGLVLQALVDRGVPPRGEGGLPPGGVASLDDAEDLKRLAAVTGVVAVRLLLRATWPPGRTPGVTTPRRCGAWSRRHGSRSWRPWRVWRPDDSQRSSSGGPSPGRAAGSAGPPTPGPGGSASGAAGTTSASWSAAR